MSVLFLCIYIFYFISNVCRTEDYLDYLKWEPLLSIYRRNEERANYNETYFSSLSNYQTNAVPVTESKYPWIARVIHSRTMNLPTVCTAICVDRGIFITAARCIINLKINYTTVAYLDHSLPAVAFVVSTHPSKQLFDDIGFIVVNDEKYKGSWVTVELFDEVKKRTDNNFRWYANLNLEDKPIEHKVVGYASDKHSSTIISPYTPYLLTELNVVVGIKLCEEIFSFNNAIKGFSVPCYHSCSLQEFRRKAEECNRYHGVEGGALINTRTNKLLGVSTWGPQFTPYYLPVGFSVPNSDNFYEDFACAQKIRDSVGTEKASHGYYQSLCDK